MRRLGRLGMVAAMAALVILVFRDRLAALLCGCGEAGRRLAGGTSGDVPFANWPRATLDRRSCVNTACLATVAANDSATPVLAFGSFGFAFDPRSGSSETLFDAGRDGLVWFWMAGEDSLFRVSAAYDPDRVLSRVQAWRRPWRGPAWEFGEAWWRAVTFSQAEPLSCFAVAPGAFIVSGPDESVVSLDAVDGRLLWRRSGRESLFEHRRLGWFTTTLLGTCGSALPLIGYSRVYDPGGGSCPSECSYVYDMVDARGGTTLCRLDAPDSPKAYLQGTPVSGHAAGLMLWEESRWGEPSDVTVMASKDGSLVEVARFEMPWRYGPPVLSAEALTILSADDAVVCHPFVAGPDGTLRPGWSVSLADLLPRVKGESREIRRLGDDSLLVSTRPPRSVDPTTEARSRLLCLDAATGEVRWRSTVPDTFLGQAVLCDGVVVATSASHSADRLEVTCLNATTGAHLWSRAIATDDVLAGTAGRGAPLVAESRAVGAPTSSSVDAGPLGR